MTSHEDLMSDYRNEPYSVYKTSKIIRAFSQIERTSLFPKLNISLIGTITLDFLKNGLILSGLNEDVDLNVTCAPSEQLMQQALNPASELLKSSPDVIVIIARIEDLYPPFFDPKTEKNSRKVALAKEDVLRQLRSLLDAIRQHSSATVILHSFMVPEWSSDVVNEVINNNSEWRLVQEVNLSLSQVADEFSGIHIINTERVARATPKDHWQDSKLWYMGRISFGSKDPRVLIESWLPIIRQAVGARKKCLIVDLDNTLWGGVIGEDGLEGIKIGSDYPGNVYRDVQKQILDLWHNGVMLAIASKNNENDAREVFDNHPNMILKWDHFLAKKINWTDKATNIKEIAADLNIGLDHLVFLDDNPVECSQVKALLPQVTILQVPVKNICQYPDLLTINRFFDGSRLTLEDQQRNQMYSANIQREAAKPTAGNLDEFLSSLEMVAEFCPVTSQNCARTSQMINKTNQFNLTTKRYSETEVKKICEDKDWITITVILKDKFGDNGQVGLVFVSLDGPEATIELFLISCRVISRGLETAMLAQVIEAVKATDAFNISATYRPTPKNSLVATFYENHGFYLIEESVDGVKKYSFSLTNAVKFPKCQVQVKVKE